MNLTLSVKPKKGVRKKEKLRIVIDMKNGWNNNDLEKNF